MSFFALLLLSMIAADVIWILQTWRSTRPIAHRRWLRALAVLFPAAQLAGLLAFLFERFAGQALAMSRPVLSAIFIWHLLALPLLTLAWLAVVVGGWVRRREVAPAADGVTRREFLAMSVATAPALFTIGATAIAQPQLERFRIRRLDISLPHLPPALDGMTIAHVSDLHVGRFTRGNLLREIVAATNDLRANLVLLTGDLINFDIEDLPAALDFVKAMRGTHGVFMCVGNHDLIESPREFIRRTREAGVALLVGETATIDFRGSPVQLLGLPWAHGDAGHADMLRPLLFQQNLDAFPILLAHHPHAFDFAEGIPLTLAGHTHGGQLMLSERLGAGPAFFRYWSGLYRHGNRALVVSNGVGNWFPLRTRAPAEIIHLTLRRETI